jgi:hypothetical protein
MIMNILLAFKGIPLPVEVIVTEYETTQLASRRGHRQPFRRDRNKNKSKMKREDKKS